MLPRRLSTIVQVPERRRFSVLAEGMELLAENVATLGVDASTLDASRRDRGAAVLRCFAEEEAAKVLILLIEDGISPQSPKWRMYSSTCAR